MTSRYNLRSDLDVKQFGLNPVRFVDLNSPLREDTLSIFDGDKPFASVFLRPNRELIKCEMAFVDTYTRWKDSFEVASNYKFSHLHSMINGKNFGPIMMHQALTDADTASFYMWAAIKNIDILSNIDQLKDYYVRFHGVNLTRIQIDTTGKSLNVCQAQAIKAIVNYFSRFIGT